MRAREDHQILVHRHRHSYWQTELLAPETESDIPWRSPIVIEADVESQSHVVALREVSRRSRQRSTALCGEERRQDGGSFGAGKRVKLGSTRRECVVCGREMGVLVVRVWGRESDGRGTSANPELNRVEL
jgi:hypothetical protein